MQFSVLSTLALVSVGLAANAPIQTDSAGQPPLIARFTPRATFNITGSVAFHPLTNGSVHVAVDLKGLPASGGPFPYHIHEKPVPANGNCTGTSGHLNPFNGSTTATTPAAKEVGDLAGRHGNITSQSFSVEYVDEFLSLNPHSKAYIGGLSIVVHSNDNARLTCANITALNSTTTSSNDTHAGHASSSAVPAANGAAGMQLEMGTLMALGGAALALLI
ncbi:uncharacterized protein LODBEIA_P45580 [Lodderomyces beijingensis]|uniref:Superoxide dismutase copper/zinc binding domain-containing protein n=1 Tax=Lodderomyces beijingensis TaxID=1775926 RepID=A0ABP0ZQA6_9ASCO